MKNRIQDIKIVIGANYGDEGKGLMTDYFTDTGKRCLVVCNNGGAQRGHTVDHHELSHVFHHFGSGTLSGADTYLSRYYIINPILFALEYRKIRGYGIFTDVYRNPDCIWSTPYDMIINQIVEEYRGNNRHGSCGVGIWESVVRSGKIHIPMDKIRGNPAVLKEYLIRIREEYLPCRLKELGVDTVPERWRKIIRDEGILIHFMEDFYFLIDHTYPSDDSLLCQYERVIIENGQGLLLDRNRKEIKEHTTPSNTGLQNAAEILGAMDLQGVPVEVCYVTRTYLTRHGAGPFPGECDKEEINALMEDETNKPNAFQGTLRYGIINPVELSERIKEDFQEYAANNDFFPSLAITHMNETSNMWNSRTEISRADFQRVGIRRIYYSGSKRKEEIVEEDQE